MDTFDHKTASATKITQRRRISILRGVLLAATATVALIFFVLWYRNLPQEVDCNRTSSRIVLALTDYVQKNGRYPTQLDTLNVRKGRYGTEHFVYRFIGFGARKQLPDQTIIAYCQKPHEFFHKGEKRNVILTSGSKIVFVSMNEETFQKLLKLQLPPESFL
jgi:hypothetical protein